MCLWFLVYVVFFCLLLFFLFVFLLPLPSSVRGKSRIERVVCPFARRCSSQQSPEDMHEPVGSLPPLPELTLAHRISDRDALSQFLIFGGLARVSHDVSFLFSRWPVLGCFPGSAASTQRSWRLPGRFPAAVAVEQLPWSSHLTDAT